MILPKNDSVIQSFCQKLSPHHPFAPPMITIETMDTDFGHPNLSGFFHALLLSFIPISAKRIPPKLD
jgi:hypothetical protein